MVISFEFEIPSKSYFGNFDSYELVGNHKNTIPIKYSYYEAIASFYIYLSYMYTHNTYIEEARLTVRHNLFEEASFHFNSFVSTIYKE